MANTAKVTIQWKAEDDLLLKKSIEAGASLEALAKGAVQFSRRFTLQELRDRWLSLLYDPNVAEQASANMFALEYYGPNPSSKLFKVEHKCNGSKVSKKRKVESIRKKYYLIRKKLRSEFLSNSDLGFIEPNPRELSGHALDFRNQLTANGNLMARDHFTGNLGLQEEVIDNLRHAFPEAVGDLAVASSTVDDAACLSSFKDNGQNVNVRSCDYNENICLGLAKDGNTTLEENILNEKASVAVTNCSSDENETSNLFGSYNPDDFGSFEDIVHASDGSHLCHWRIDQTCSTPPEPSTMILEDKTPLATDEIPESHSSLCTAQLSDPNSRLNPSNEDETIRLEDVSEKDAGNKSPVEDSTRDCQQNDVSNIEAMNVTGLEVSSVPCTENPPVSKTSVTSTHRSEQLNPQPDDGMPLKLSANYNAAELGGEKMLCTLNEQVTEVPCNDDIFLLILTPSSSPSRYYDPSVGYIGISGVHENDQELKSFGWHHELGLHGIQESVSAHPIVSCRTKTQMHGSISQTTQAGFVNKIVGESSKGKLFYSSIDRLMEEDKNNKVWNHRAANIEIQQSMEAESELDSSSSDDEEYPVDDDVPYFSDVEAMILEMDLDARNQEFDITKRVPSFKYDETKRTIMRLEQGARSCLRRTMTSKRAFAVLYGRHLKYYFRKPEALLGRSTDEIDVDIDLSKEGRANKISRRQAIIKMEADGSFMLKNIGKCSVFVNGMEVASRQTKNLSSSCLIEIRDMSFVFEINQRYVGKQKK